MRQPDIVVCCSDGQTGLGLSLSGEVSEAVERGFMKRSRVETPETPRQTTAKIPGTFCRKLLLFLMTCWYWSSTMDAQAPNWSSSESAMRFPNAARTRPAVAGRLWLLLGSWRALLRAVCKWAVATLQQSYPQELCGAASVRVTEKTIYGHSCRLSCPIVTL